MSFGNDPSRLERKGKGEPKDLFNVKLCFSLISNTDHVMAAFLYVEVKVDYGKSSFFTANIFTSCPRSPHTSFFCSRSNEYTWFTLSKQNL